MGKFCDLTNQKFERLTVIERVFDKKYIKPHWRCICDCGNEIITSSYLLKSGQSKSCGCLKKENISKKTTKDLTGQRFGQLIVLKRDLNPEKIGHGKHAYWICECSCGNIISSSGQSLRNGQISCGCKKSLGEELIRNWLKQYNIPFKSEYSFPDLLSKKNRKLRYDFAIFNKNGELIRLVEFDGIQHIDKNDNFYSEEGVQRDKMKNEYALKNNIPLVRIPYSHLKKMTILDILTDDFLVKE